MAEQTNTNRRKRAQQPVDNTYGHLQPQALEVEKAVLGYGMETILAQTIKKVDKPAGPP